jgi:hypothetical protein
VISTVNPEARHTHKSPHIRRDGYRAHVAAGPDIGSIPDGKLTQAAGADNSDQAVAREFVPPRSAPLAAPQPPPAREA